MANARSRTKQSPRRDRLREQAERASIARVLGLPKGTRWRDIAATELAEQESERFREDSEWFYEQDILDMECELSEESFSYSSTIGRSPYLDDYLDDDRFDWVWDI